MKIGIDVTASIYLGTGVASYYRSLVPELLKQGERHDFVLLGYACRRFGQLDLANRKIPFPPRVMEFLWNRVHRLPVEWFVGQVDVFHAWDYLQPPAKKAKIVTTIHDLTTLKFPIHHHPSTVEAQGRRLGWVRREADLILVDSKATQSDVVELLGVDESKVKVVYLAAAKQYGEFRIKNQESRIKEIDRIRKKYGIEGEYLLSVGTLEPRKNIKRIIEAFSALRSSLFALRSLVIAGHIGWGEELKPQPRVKLIGRVPDDDLPPLYAGAQALVYPSLYEGFGLPVLEAMAVGCPVVTSDRGSLKEVAGKAAVLVDPEDVGSIADGIKTAVKKREDFIKKGLKQAAKFSWEKTARGTLEVYQEVVAG